MSRQKSFLDEKVELVSPLTINDPLKYYSGKTKNLLGFDVDGTTKAIKLSKDADEYSIFLDKFTYSNDNSIENRINEENHSRDMLLLSITKPAEFLQSKAALLQLMQNAALNIRKQMFRALVDYGVSGRKSELASGAIGSQIYNVMSNYLHTEIFPSTLENEIVNRKTNKAVKGLTNPLTEQVIDKP